MKKLALILALIIIPCSAFGLEMLNDNAMDQVTGQAGVSIALDDVQMFINIEKFAYIDCDGFNTASGYGTCVGSPGAVAINNFQIDVLNMNAIVASADTGDGGIQSTGNQSMPLYSTGCGLIPLFYDYGTSAAPGCYLGSDSTTAQTLGLDNYLTSSALGTLAGAYFQARALTIDVTDDLPSLTEGFQNNMGTLPNSSFTVGGVLIGIPTLEIYINNLSMTPVYDGDIAGASSTAVNDDSRASSPSYGTIVLQGVTFTTLSGWLEIAPH